MAQTLKIKKKDGILSADVFLRNVTQISFFFFFFFQAANSFRRAKHQLKHPGVTTLQIIMPIRKTVEMTPFGQCVPVSFLRAKLESVMLIFVAQNGQKQ